MSLNINKAIVWGDSVAKGVIFDDARRRYTLADNTAVKIIADKLGIEITNRSRMGSTINEGLALIDRDLESGLGADVALIEFGGNDCDFNWKEISESPDASHLPRTTAEAFEAKMNEAISKVRSAGITPMLINLPPIDAENYFKFISGGDRSPENILHWLGDKNHIYRFHERYSRLIDEIAKKNSCRIFNVRSAFLDLWDSRSLLCSDGIHPNENGQKFMSKVILEQI